MYTAVDEKVSIDGHLKVIEWIHTLVQNAVCLDHSCHARSGLTQCFYDEQDTFQG